MSGQPGATRLDLTDDAGAEVLTIDGQAFPREHTETRTSDSGKVITVEYRPASITITVDLDGPAR